MCSFKLIYFIIFILNLYGTKGQISDKRMCVDEHCKEPVSLAKTLQRYSSPDPLRLSFPPNVNVTIYSKEAGSETSLWGAEIGGKRGYIPKMMVRETKVFKKPTLLVDTEVSKPKVPENVIQESPKPNKVKQSFEVVDGTTLYTDTDIQPSSTESPVLPTSTPTIDKEEKLKDSSTTDGTVEKEENSVVTSFVESIANWVKEEKGLDDDEDDEEDQDDEDEEDEDTEEDEEEELSNSTKNKDTSGVIENVPSADKEPKVSQNDLKNSEEKLSSSVKSTGKFKLYSFEQPTESGDLTEDQKSGSANIDNNIQQGNEATSVLDTVPQLYENADSKDSLSDVGQIETTTVNPAEDGDIRPPLQEDVTTVTPIATEPPGSTEGSTESDMKISEDSKEYQESEENIPNEDDVNATNQEMFKEISNNLNLTDDNTITLENTPDSSEKIVDQDHEIQNEIQDVSVENISSETGTNVNDAVPSPPSQILFKHTLTPNSTVELSGNSNTDVSPEIEKSESVEQTKETNLEQDTSNEYDIVINPNIIENTVPVVQESEHSQEIHNIEDEPEKTTSQINLSSEKSTSGGIFSEIFSFFSSDNKNEELPIQPKQENSEWSFQDEVLKSNEGFCKAEHIDCKTKTSSNMIEDIQIYLTSDFCLYLITTAISCTIFLFVYLVVDKNRRVSPLIARINKLEKDLLVSLKENELLQEKSESVMPVIEVDSSNVPSEIVEKLERQLLDLQFAKNHLESQVFELQKEMEDKQTLELQIESLEKELETSTEVGLELNRIISEMLDPENGSDRLKENVEQLQRQLLEQKGTINSVNATLSEKEVENANLLLEVESNKKKCSELQNQLDEIVEKILQVEKEKEEQQKALQNEISIYQRKYNDLAVKDDSLNKEVQILRSQLSDTQRQLEVKIKEFQSLKENIGNINSLQNNNEALTSIFNSVSMKAEYEQLKNENERYTVELHQAQLERDAYEKNYQRVLEEMEILKQKYEEADKEKVEINMKLEVLTNYFKKREAELQEEILKLKSIWDVKEGEATSSTEHIRLLKEEIENYKSQNEMLKQEIISQEIDLKSQISVLEKKGHENWLAARQTERRLEDARQEAAQLRNRLTLRERAIDDRAQNRLQSPLEQNGELTTFSPHPIDSPASPPLLYSRDHMTKSPPVPGLPFIPPPPGAPFLPPPPLHGLPFVPMPPPPLFPGDRRPPPLGRMSSPPPPLNSRYSPDTSAFSPYDRNTPSPPYDSEYGASPPPIRGYSPYRDDRRDYKRIPPPPHIRSNGRNAKGSVLSSGSDRSNESLDKINRNQSKMV